MSSVGKGLTARRSSRFAILYGVMAVLTLSGCVTVRETLSDVGAATKRDFLQFSGNQSPVLIRAINSPFREDPRTVAAIVSRHAREAIAGAPVDFTEDANLARKPNFRLVFLFDPVSAVSPKDICSAERVPPHVTVTPGELHLHGAFCSDDEPIAGVLATGPAPKDLYDPAFAKLVRMTVAEMFPEQDRNGPRKQNFMTSLRFHPKPGFRLNPLGGIFE